MWKQQAGKVRPGRLEIWAQAPVRASEAGSSTQDTIQVGTITITGGYVSAKAGGTDAAGIGIGGGGVKPSGELVSDRTGSAWVETDSLILGAGSGTDGTGKFLSGVLFIGNE